MSAASINETIGKYRWTICALVFFATTVNYFDRNVLGLLKPTLAEEGIFGADKANQELYYSWVVMSFQIAYAIGMTLAGGSSTGSGPREDMPFRFLAGVLRQ